MNLTLKKFLILTSTLILTMIVSRCISKPFFEKSLIIEINQSNKETEQKIDGIQDNLDKIKNETQERFDKINKNLDKLIDELEKNERENKNKGGGK
ncbi:MAG: putative secreted protein [Candidatus Phytoplasma asteris]|uniref:Uncharacterized protein n=1 Tax='Chrysanthemum coronarium' phytoplasma TaxID=1520703 RepID=A0ABQ0J399_9MOLU|nr:hypothetical protein ['Chrysanthemum coronarium' phytoplasma]TKA87949.1 MAG: putative secreted protein [Periwinkle leaf yellowing phytoplasma]WEX19618.1 MAG: putative secreted protein [Candidatus Phytoplasma asteris]GAK74044.1 uncharacterized protein OYV_05320 ['Chrysanthemum coronarium' phytoplasma]